ncbi:MAG: HGGxSTG domain-containing protein [Panacagrimonas sp.]
MNFDENRVHRSLTSNDPRACITGFGGPRCGAYARSTGKPCEAKALGNGRCRNHGGLSTGPRTVEGRSRACANLKQWRR